MCNKGARLESRRNMVLNLNSMEIAARISRTVAGILEFLG